MPPSREKWRLPTLTRGAEMSGGLERGTQVNTFPGQLVQLMKLFTWDSLLMSAWIGGSTRPPREPFEILLYAL